MRNLILACLLSVSTALAAHAQDVRLRVHHFMSAQSTLHTEFLIPWAEALEQESEGRISVQLFEGMSLGGAPGDLYDQAADGAVDIILTLPGYTPGRFQKAEVFELPFMMEDPVVTSQAYWDLIEGELQGTEFGEVQVLAAWVHGPGVLHTREPIERLEDLQGKEMRGPTRVVTELLGELGATPVGMPLPSIPESLSRGVISGAVLPWEVTPSIRLAELVDYHTELAGDRALYTATFILAMNPDVYANMPEDLRAILDANTGKSASTFAATVQSAADAFGRAQAAGNQIIRLDEAEVARWIAAAEPVYARWVEWVARAGVDGEAAIEEARALIAANQ